MNIKTRELFRVYIPNSDIPTIIMNWQIKACFFKIFPDDLERRFLTNGDIANLKLYGRVARNKTEIVVALNPHSANMYPNPTRTPKKTTPQVSEHENTKNNGKLNATFKPSYYFLPYRSS
jgi:hypothetical protein